VSERLRWAAIVAIAALAIGVLVGVFLVPPVLTPSAAPAPATRLVPTTERSFDDAHKLSATPALTDSRQVLASGASGLVSASWCEVGADVATGAPLLSVNGVVVLALVSDVPLWRDLTTGTAGPDVEGVQRALGVPVTGKYDRATVAAVIALQKAASVTASGRLTLDRVQWVPASAGPVASCDVAVGTPVGPGQALFTVGGGLASLTLPASSSELPDRAYVAGAGDAVVPVPEDRTITDPAFLAEVASSYDFAVWKREQADGVPVQLRLAEPVDSLGVPPAAVVLADGDSGCVLDADRTPVPVRILASELGTVYLVPEHPVAKVLIPASEVIAACP